MDGDARLRMLVAAERLFAERGIGAVSLREIGAAAGQRNNSAAQYHFGTRQNLVAAILDLRHSAASYLAMSGASLMDIAAILGITESTVKKYVQEIFEKLGVETRGAAIVRALEVLNPGGS